jgi:hypothetical protein
VSTCRLNQGPIYPSTFKVGVLWSSASSIAAVLRTMPLPTGAMAADPGLLFVRTKFTFYDDEQTSRDVRRDFSPSGEKSFTATTQLGILPARGRSYPAPCMAPVLQSHERLMIPVRVRSSALPIQLR